jgi:hypothetical protein
MDSSVFNRKIYRIAVVEQSRKFGRATNRGPKGFLKDFMEARRRERVISLRTGRFKILDLKFGPE